MTYQENNTKEKGLLGIEKFVLDKQATSEIFKILIQTFCPHLSEKSEAYRYFQDAIEEKLSAHFNRLREGLVLLVETCYIDKVYRDCYYNFFSTKSKSYPRNCIRVSIFDNDLTSLQNFDYHTIKDINKASYLGFIILRPTLPDIIGRSVISPKALRNSNFYICEANFMTSSGGIKLNVLGFPHMSQDEQYITCAETTLWGIMEYFGTKYSEYATILPSTIFKLLENITTERQLPSTGLVLSKISYALKKLGLGPKIYEGFKSNSKEDEHFRGLLNCYIESGIPLILGVSYKVMPINDLEGKQTETDNTNKYPKDYDDPQNREDFSGHVILCIGHTKEVASECKDFIANHFEDYQSEKSNTPAIFDWGLLPKEYILIDEYSPAYSKGTFDEILTLNERDKKINKVKSYIEHILVPLYHKVYMDAKFAKTTMLECIKEKENWYPLKHVPEKAILRVFLASSRTYREYVIRDMGDHGLNNDLKELFLCLELPKFLWVGEISNFDFENDIDPDSKLPLVKGLILLDPTEVLEKGKQTIVLICDSNCITHRDSYGEIITTVISGKSESLQPFKRFINLKEY